MTNFSASPNRLIALAACAFAVAMPPLAHCAGTSAPAKGQAAFQRVLDKLDAAEKSRDITLWASVLRANSMAYFTLKIPGGPATNLEQTISAERQFLTTMRSIDVDTERITSFVVSGNFASAGVTGHSSALVVDDTGQLARPGAAHRFDITTRVAYSLIWKGNGWKIQSATQTPVTITVDGHRQSVP